MNAKNIDNISVGNRIRSIRKQKGLTMEEFGRFFDPPAYKSVVSNWERGHNLPNNARLKVIAQFDEITVDELLRGALNMNAAEKAALDRIKESLEEFPDSRMAQQIFSKDLEVLIKLVEKCVKK